MISISVTSLANPNAVVNLSAHFDEQYNLITPDKFLLRKAIQAYQKGYNGDALTKFKQAAAFGNSDAQMYVGMMYLKALGVSQDWAKGYAWIKLAALDGTKKHLDLMLSVYAQLKDDEVSKAAQAYETISAEYGQSMALQRRDRWVKKQKSKSTGSLLGSQTGNVNSFNSLRDLSNGTVSGSNTADSAFREMEKFVNEYNFGIVTSGEIKPKQD
jgi:TPR repeat protein